MTSHHLILGTLTDFITGRTIEDNHDERYRQKIARLLVEKKGYSKTDIEKNLEIFLENKENKFKITVDYTIYIDKKPVMIVKYGPGSIVSRHMSAIACARLIDEHEIPVCVITNGEDADTIDTQSGKTISKGLDKIPSPAELKKIPVKRKLDSKIRDKAKKILFAFEVDGRCPCDDSICIKNHGE
ncbi:MAG: type I restriction enzyme HsdR N-terminal domain-containing protein [Desulfobacteraceae bacterium]|nr:type I restriction enzyme HsdR N-terminal domain-containing protein [Desulfobacteraceae bacterium]MCB9494110.1 type I restriction enzyme HsdR N-terminal domain-containing protein [Desulfobacteraceae bacterium]